MRFCPGNYGNAPNLLLQLSQSQKSCKCDFTFNTFFIATQVVQDREIIIPFFHSLFKCEIVNIKWHFTLWDDFFFLLCSEGSNSIQCNKLKESDENKCKVLSSRLDIYKLLFCQIFFLSLLLLLQLSKQ